MTQPITRPVTPASVSLVRLLAVVQVVIGLGACAMLGFLALLGLAWSVDDGSGTPVVVAIITLFAVCLTTTIAMICLAFRLRPGADGVRVALLVIESVVVTVVLALLTTGGAVDWLGNVMLAPTLYAACGIGTIVALSQRSARAWSAGPGCPRA